MDQLKLLMDYTKFHLGVYITLGVAGLALVRAGEVPAMILAPAFGGFFLAGVGGGVIASHIPESSSFEAFVDRKIGPWGFEIARYRFWALLEHTSFWLGLLAAGCAVLMGGKPG